MRTPIEHLCFQLVHIVIAMCQSEICFIVDIMRRNREKFDQGVVRGLSITVASLNDNWLSGSFVHWYGRGSKWDFGTESAHWTQRVVCLGH